MQKRLLKFRYESAGDAVITDEEKLQTIDLSGGTSPEKDVIWALNLLLNMPDEELPLFAE